MHSTRAGKANPSPEREICLRVLSSVSTEGAYANLELDDALKAADGYSGFATEVVYGVLRRRATLDWIIEHAAGRPLSKMTVPVPDILRIALYQTLFMDTVPSAVAVNEAVLMARSHSHEGSAKFVNGVLRGIGRLTEKAGGKLEGLLDSMGLKSDGRAFAYYNSILYSHPKWLVKRWIDKFGINDALALCRANNIPPKVCFRTNLMKIERDDLIGKLACDGISATAGALTPEAVICDSFPRIPSSRLFKQGLFQVQDEGAILIGRMLDPKPGETVLDVCSAPGGKATHCCEMMGDKGRVIAMDLYENRLKLVRENAGRLGLSSIECIAADARDLSKTALPEFDRILVDAPCMGTGVVRRKPDIRWRRSDGDLQGLVRLQRDILSSVVPYLKRGGVLVYSTCSLETEENEGNVGWLLSEFPYLKPEPLNRHTQDFLMYTLPHMHGTDGFFMAKLTKC